MATCSEYEQGYDDNRFEIVVSEEFHCAICLLVLKDPIMCKNQHYYCSSCIKEYLANADSCPTCRQHLSVDSLIPAPRVVTNYLSKLNIHCDFYSRGCREVIQLSSLKRHVANCVFSPMHRQDEIRHEMKHEMKEMKHEMKAMIDQVLAGQGFLVDKMVNEIKEDIKNQMKNEMKEIREEMKNEMKEIVVNAVQDALGGIRNLAIEMEKQSSQGTCSLNAREDIIVAGGIHIEGGRSVMSKSTERFNWADQTWTLLISAVFEGRSYTCSFLYQDQMVVAGGDDYDGNKMKTLKCLNVANPSATWKDFAVSLPVNCSNHQVVNYNDRLFISGGWVEDEGGSTHSDAVNEVQLFPPYYSKMLTRLPQPRSFHGMELFDDKLFILGGHNGKKITNSVVQYDLIKSKCKRMPPLPYAVQLMATVVWQNNVVVIGGLDQHCTPLNTVFMYDLISSRSQMMPSMRHKRYGCTAVLSGNVVVVMGGENENCEYLKSVECFDLEHQVWQNLPDMLQPRAFATAVVKPSH